MEVQNGRRRLTQAMRALVVIGGYQLLPLWQGHVKLAEAREAHRLAIQQRGAVDKASFVACAQVTWHLNTAMTCCEMCPWFQT